MKQVLAVIGALLLIGGAFFVRTEFIEGDDVAVDGGGGTATTGGPAGAILCDAVLADACPAGSTVRTGAQIVAAFVGADVPADAVVAPLMVIDLINGGNQSEVMFDGDPTVLATTAMVLVTQTTAVRSAIDDPCTTDPTWACVAGLVSSGELDPGLANPQTATDGLAGLAALAGGYFADNDAPFNLNGFQSGGFVGWIGSVQREVTTAGGAVENILRFNGARNNSAIVTEAEALDVINRAAAADRLSLRYPTPLVSLAAVVATVQGRDADLDRGAITDALTDAGWRGPDGAPTDPTAPAISDDDGLPSGGVLFALRQRWQ